MTTFTVTSNLDSGTGTLRDDLAMAKSGDIINFASNVTEIDLADSLIIQRGGVTIEGHQGGGTGSPGVTINGGGKVVDFRILSGTSVTIDGLSVVNGYGVGAFGLDNSGSIGGGFVLGQAAGLTISNSIIANNVAKGAPPNARAAYFGGLPGGSAAGGIYVGRNATLNLVGNANVFSGNSATGGMGQKGGGGYVTASTYDRTAGGAGGAGAALASNGMNTIGGTGGNGQGPYGGRGGTAGLVGKDGAYIAGSSKHGPAGGGGGGNAFSDYGGAGQVVCFATGTKIRTVRGQCAVEDLVVGDVAVTASGGTRPIVWIGHRDVECRGHHDLQPVLVAAHAFGDGLPERDLMLSPGHPVLVGADADNEGGHLVPIMCLINGTTVLRQTVERVTYWHVELDQHDILLAEELPAESYLDWGDRDFFRQGSEHALENPDFVVPGLAGRCRPVALDGPVVEVARRRLDVAFATRLTAAAAWPASEGDAVDI